jgi:hypothetical protein
MAGDDGKAPGDASAYAMTGLSSFLRVIGYGVSIGLVVSVTAVLVDNLVVNQSPTYVQGLVGAFMGAFFAFLFIRLGETLTRIGRRRLEHHNALVDLEHSLNDAMNLYQENIQLTGGAILRCDLLASEAPFPAILPFVYSKFAVQKEALPRLTNIGLTNEVFGLNVDMRRINATVDVFQEGMARLEAWAADGKLGQEHYREAPGMLRGELADFQKVLAAGFDRTVNALALVRLLSRNRPLFLRLMALLTKSRLSSRQIAMKDAEVAKIHEEIRLVQKRQEERMKAAGLGVRGTGAKNP